MKDEGVSSVVAAVLVFGLFSTSFLLWTLNTQPEWIADREHQHLTDVKQDFGSLQAGLERLSAANDQGPVTASFQLAAKPLALLQPATNQGDLGTVSGGMVFSSTTSAAKLISSNGQATGVGAATSALGAPANVQGIRVLDVSFTGGTGTWWKMQATDGTATVTVEAMHESVAASCGGAGVSIVVTLDTTVLRRVPVACGTSGTVTGLPINIMSPAYGVLSALQPLGGEFSLTFAESAEADDATTLAWVDQNGAVHIAGSPAGQDASASIDVTGDVVKFSPNAQQFPNQKVFWDGSVSLLQNDLGAMIRQPGFQLTVDRAAATGYLRWTVVDMAATGGLGGSGSAQVSVSHVATQTMLMQASSEVSFTINTAAATAWENFFSDQITLAGETDETTPAIASSRTADMVALSLSQGGSGINWIIDLRIIHATVTIQ